MKKKIILIIVAVCVIAVGGVCAFLFAKDKPNNEFKIADWVYETNESEMYLKEYTGSETDIVIPKTCKLDGGTYTIKKFGLEGKPVFNNKRITKLTLPTSIVSFGFGCLKDCYYLKEISLPFIGAEAPEDAITQFGYVGETDTHFGYLFGTTNYLATYAHVPPSLNKISINSEITALRDYSFFGCIYVKNIIIPDTITTIGRECFANCKALKEIVLPSELTTIGNRAFNNCKSISIVTFPTSLTEILDYAFKDCISLYNVNFVPGLTEIHEGSFSGCDSLSKIKLPNTLETIADYAFEECPNLMSLEIPASVTSIGSYICYESPKIMHIRNYSSATLSNLQVILNAEYKTDGSAFTNNLVFGPKYVTHIVGAKTYLLGLTRGLNEKELDDIPSTVTDIAQSAFKNNFNLVKVNLQQNIKSIGNRAFSNCTNLVEIDIPSSVTKLPEFCFSFCDNLVKVTLPQTLTECHEKAFYWSDTVQLRNLSALEVDLEADEIKRDNSAFTNTIEIGDKFITYEDGSDTILLSVLADLAQPSICEIPDNITKINEYVFDSCYYITAIILPKSVKAITNAFVNTELADVFYKGTAAEYSEITITDDSVQASTVYTYSDTLPDETCNSWHYVNGYPVIWEFA